MPTLSSDPVEPHKHRNIAESFGVDPQRYDRARPCYPTALVNRILAACPGRDVLDVGTGTGIAARQFHSAGASVLGIEPDVRMAEFARNSGVATEVATFEAWDPAGRDFDVVIAGQAWHWVEPVAGAAKAARVLRPEGRLAVFGHVFDSPPVVAEASAEALRRVAPDAPMHQQRQPARTALEIYQAMFAKFTEDIRAAGEFGEPEQWRFDWEQSYTRDEWLDLIPTTGALTLLAPDQLAEVLDHVGAAIDKIGGGFTMPYTTLTATAVRS